MAATLAVIALVGLGGAAALLARSPVGRHPLSRSCEHRTRPAPPGVAVALAELGIDADAVWGRVLASAGLGVGVLGALGGPVPAVLAAGVLGAAPRLVAPAIERRVRRRRDEQLPSALERLAAELRSGRALGPALIDVAEHLPAPLGDELRAVASEVRHGAGVTTALQRWAGRPGASPEVRLTASALALGSEAGGHLARSVDDLAATLRERRELRAEARALATQARASAGVLILAPPAFTLLVSTVEPGTLRFLLGTPAGWACLLGGIGLDVAGARWMARIVASQ